MQFFLYFFIDDLHEKENFEMKRSFMQDNVIRTDVITCKILGIRKPKLTPDLPRPQFNGSDSDVQWVEIRWLLTILHFEHSNTNFTAIFPPKIDFYIFQYQKCKLTRPSNVANRQTNSLTLYMGVCGLFLPVKFATSLLASLTGG